MHLFIAKVYVVVIKKFQITVSKFLILSGRNEEDYVSKAQFVELSKSGNYHKCPDWIEDYPIKVEKATGGFLETNPIVCGGKSQPLYFEDVTNQCYAITPKNVLRGPKMLTKRHSAASVVIFDTYLWVSGGQDDINNILSSTEFIQWSGTIKGPELPIELSEHAMINLRCSHHGHEIFRSTLE